MRGKSLKRFSYLDPLEWNEFYRKWEKDGYAVHTESYLKLRKQFQLVGREALEKNIDIAILKEDFDSNKEDREK